MKYFEVKNINLISDKKGIRHNKYISIALSLMRVYHQPYDFLKSGKL